jgi:hypothetical protein
MYWTPETINNCEGENGSPLKTASNEAFRFLLCSETFELGQLVTSWASKLNSNHIQQANSNTEWLQET